MPRKASAAALARKAASDGGVSLSVAPPASTTIHTKKMVLDDSDSDDSDDEAPVIKVNEEYARRFEHNKKREELQRLEEKYGAASDGNANKRQKTDDSEADEDDEDDSSDESEDELGELALGELDAQFQATLAALKSKDPKVYDLSTTFFTDPNAEPSAPKEKKEKSMTLKQYHQQNLLDGYTGEEVADVPRTHVQEQEHIKRSVIRDLNDAASEASEDDDFLIAKSGPITARKIPTFNPPPSELPSNPEADPEAFLSTFLDTKAWLPRDANGNTIPLGDSDDSEEEQQAEDFEHAYNMRFEDPTLANRSEVITHARDVAAKMSLRREDKSRRKKARDERSDRKTREMEEREADKKRLRKLQVEEMERKMKMVREAGGLLSASDEEEETEVAEGDKKWQKLDKEWQKFLEHGWEGDDEWEERMGKMFGENYYRKPESTGKKVQKPTWEDDIDITDIVPDFVDEAAAESISDAEPADEDEDEQDETGDITMEDVYAGTTKKSKSKSKTVKPATKSESRILRAKIESHVDSHLPISLPAGAPSTRRGGAPTRFRYREATPESYNLTATDILFAPDKQLNEYAGLKKLASFRDDGKKLKDRRRYNKGRGFKAREWRKEVFGKSEVSWEDMVKKMEGKAEVEVEKKKEKSKKRKVETGTETEENINVEEGEKKSKKRRRNKKKEGAEGAVAVVME